MSEINDALFYTLAQVAIALAGFSGLAIGLVAQNKSDWGTFEKANAWFIFGFAVLAFLMSIIPPVLISAGADADFGFIVGLGVAAVGVLPPTFVSFVVIHRLLASKEVNTWRVQTPVARFILYWGRIWAALGTLTVWAALFDFLMPRNEAVYVALTLVVIIVSLIHFAFFLGLSMEEGDRK